MDKRKVICICFVIILIFGAFLGLIFVKDATISESVVCVYSEGKLIRMFEISSVDNYTFDIKNSKGGTNIVQVKDGKVGVISADCPDKICVNTEHISNGITPIVCVPNKLVIQIEAKRAE